MPRGIIVLLLVIFSALSLVFVACGEEAAPEATPTAEATPASGDSTPAPADTPAPTAIPSAQPTRVPTPTPGVESMEGVEGQILRDVELADLSLFGCCHDPILETDGTPHGNLYHCPPLHPHIHMAGPAAACYGGDSAALRLHRT